MESDKNIEFLEEQIRLAKRKKRRDNKKGRFAKLIIASVIVLNIIFTGFVLYIFLRVGNEPSTLIASFFAFTTGELWMLSSIKKTKVKEVENYEQQG